MPHPLSPLQTTVTRRGMLAGALASLTLGLAACHGDDTSRAASPGATSASGSGSEPAGPSPFPETVKHAWGSTTITSRPSRVATVGWGGQDALIALGLAPVGMPRANYGDEDGDGMLPWVKEGLAKLGATGSKAPAMYDETNSIVVEAVANTDPDLVVGLNSGMTKEEYAKLSRIAPTLPYFEKAWNISWQAHTQTVAKALGQQAKGEEVVAACRKAIDEAVAAQPAMTGRTAAMFYLDPKKLSTLSVYTTGDSRADYLTDLGLAVPASVKKLSAKSDQFYTEVSAENADMFDDVDVIVSYGDPATLLEALRSNPLLARVRAVKNGCVAVIGDNTALAASMSPTALSIPARVGELTRTIGAAAAKVA